MLCTDANYVEDWIAGISLLTGIIGSCSIENCGVAKLSPDEAMDRAEQWEQWAQKRGLEPDKAKYFGRRLLRGTSGSAGYRRGCRESRSARDPGPGGAGAVRR
jgi:hypothetical protein